MRGERLPRAVVALDRELVERLPREPPPLGDPFRALALVDQLVPGEKLGVQAAEAAVAAVGIDVEEHPHPRHVLHAAADGVPRVARGDRLRGEMDRLLARTAHAVQGDRRDRDRETGQQYAEPPDVRPLFTGLRDGAAYDVLYAGRVDAGARHDPLQDMREQGIGPGIAERAAAFAERRADGGKDDGNGHVERRAER